MAGPKIPGHEVCEVLRKAISGQLIVELGMPSVTWDEVYAGIVPFRFDNWQISFYNDCDELDYCEAAIAPNGRSEVFLTWQSMSAEPVSLLTDSERQALEQILKSVGCSN
jgi:hypothetical protein